MIDCRKKNICKTERQKYCDKNKLFPFLLDQSAIITISHSESQLNCRFSDSLKKPNLMSIGTETFDAAFLLGIEEELSEESFCFGGDSGGGKVGQSTGH